MKKEQDELIKHLEESNSLDNEKEYKFQDFEDEQREVE